MVYAFFFALLARAHVYSTGNHIYTTLLFGLDKHMAFSFSMISFVSSFLFYFPVNALAGKIGRKNLMLLAYLVLGVIFLITALAKDLPVSKEYLLYALAVAAAAPLAIFGIMPNVIVGNEAALEEQKSGQQLTGMYFGMTAFTMKIGISAANLIFPSLLLLGRSMENPASIQATAIAASIFCFAGCWTFRNYVDLLIR